MTEHSHLLVFAAGLLIGAVWGAMLTLILFLRNRG